MTITLSDVQLLSDDDLYAKLSEFNENLGPIVDSTRSTYQLMLMGLLNKAESMLDDKEKIVESPPIAAKYDQKSRRSVSKAPEDEQLEVRSNPSPHTFKRWNEVDDPLGNQLFDDAVSFRSRASLASRPPISLYDTRLPPPAKKGGSAIKTVLLLAFVFVLAAFIIFVVTQARDPYQNIESEANSEIEGNDGDL